MKNLNKMLLLKNVSNTIKNDIEENNIAGAAVLVAQHGKILLDERFGSSNFLSQKPLERNSIFRLASMTKPVTAVAALIGVQQGWFDLSDPVSKHFPNLTICMSGGWKTAKLYPTTSRKRPCVCNSFYPTTTDLWHQVPFMLRRMNLCQNPHLKATKPL